MKALGIYKKYQIPKNLQEHMLRVAGFAEVLFKHWTGTMVDQKAIIQACSFHDMAKPITFNLRAQAQFGATPTEIVRLKKLQERLKADYGNSEHQATIKICQEIGLSPIAVKIVNNLEWNNIPILLKENDIESLIPIYSDMRIGPNGVLSLNKRLNEIKKRVNDKDYGENLKNGNALEELIKRNINIAVDSITDIQINQHFQKLLDIKI